MFNLFAFKNNFFTDPYLASFYPVYSLAANFSNPYQNHVPKIVSFVIDTNFIPEGEDDKVQIDILLHSDLSVVLYSWKTLDENWKILFIRHKMLTWKLKIAQGNMFHFDYNLSEKSMICNEGILDKMVGWPEEKFLMEKLVNTLNYQTFNDKKDKLSQQTFKWLLKCSSQYLAELGYNFLATNKKGQTLLHFAARAKDPNYIQCILPKYSSVNIFDNDNVSPLHEACQHGNYEVAKKLLEENADANARIKSTGQTCLMLVAGKADQDAKFVKLLLKYNANCDLEDIHGMRAVDFARQICKKSPIIQLIHPILSQI